MTGGVFTGLDAVAWDELDHAYGYATDIPGQLRDFVDADDEERRRLVHGWYGNLFHQGSRYSAPPAAMPFLAELAGSTGPRRGAVVVLLVHLLAGFPEEYTPSWRRSRRPWRCFAGCSPTTIHGYARRPGSRSPGTATTGHRALRP